MEAEEPRLSATLPPELLLEIIARSNDVKTVVRCAVGSKPLRRAMLDPGFLDRLRRRAEANDGFDPGLLMSVSYRPTACHSDSDSRQGTATGTHPVVVQQVQPPGRPGFDTNLLLGSFQHPPCRDGLVVVRRNEILLVCNTITGHVTSLPRMEMGLQRGTGITIMYRPALLSVDGAGRSFELLVMYYMQQGMNFSQERMLTQTFSSREGEWGAAHEIDINIPWQPPSNAPAVMGRSVHWLSYANSGQLINLALRTESAHVSTIKLPQDLPVTRIASSVILATTATAQGEKRLSLIVVEALVISTWTLVTEGSSISWCRQEVIRRKEIGSPLASVLDAYQSIRFCMFGERSGTLLFWMQSIGIVQLNLGTKKALVLCRDSIHPIDFASQALVHEINLISVLECMKTF